MKLFEHNGKKVTVLHRMEVLGVNISYRSWQGVRHTGGDVVTSSQYSWSLPVVLDLCRNYFPSQQPICGVLCMWG